MADARVEIWSTSFLLPPPSQLALANPNYLTPGFNCESSSLISVLICTLVGTRRASRRGLSHGVLTLLGIETAHLSLIPALIYVPRQILLLNIGSLPPQCGAPDSLACNPICVLTSSRVPNRFPVISRLVASSATKFNISHTKRSWIHSSDR
jgi:hypothetical protein